MYFKIFVKGTGDKIYYITYKYINYLFLKTVKS